MVMICTRKPHKNSHRRTKATPDPNTSTASSEQEHSTGALPPPFSALLILPAFTNSASAWLGRRSGAATAVAAPACTIYGATQRGRVRHKQTAASRRRQKQSQKRARQNRKRVDEQRDQTSRRPMSDIDIMGANAEAEPATASIAAAKRESMAFQEQFCSVGASTAKSSHKSCAGQANRRLFRYRKWLSCALALP